MAVPAPTESKSRWVRTFRGADTFVEDLGETGSWVGPRTGPNKRTQGDKEDYVLRRLLIALRQADRLEFPVELRATHDDAGRPDFTFGWRDGRRLGLEVTEAGEEDYQRWLTLFEEEGDAGSSVAEVPFEASTSRTASEIKRAIERKVEKHDQGKYQGPDDCDLVVYDHTAWGGFLDKREIIKTLGRPNHLLGRFRRIHIVFGGVAYLDVFGDECRLVDISRSHETDYVGWILDQTMSLREGIGDKLDLQNIAEELGDLGRSDRRAVASHLKNLMIHLLKWQFKPQRRTQSWSLSIENARSELFELLTESPSLRAELSKVVAKAYLRARREAAKETGLSLADLPERCPFELMQLLDDEFLPDGNAPDGNA